VVAAPDRGAIDADQVRIDVEVEAMSLAPVPTPEEGAHPRHRDA
jgi:hypothetical protein